MSKLALFGLAAALAAPLAGPLATTASAAEMAATYRMTFHGTWSRATHPHEYPGGAHFSGVIGATHDARYVIFKSGAKATPGLKNLSEHGAHSPLDAEIRAAIRAGRAGVLFQTSPIFGPPGTVTATFTADRRHPMVSLGAMIAPSPDWFTGVSAVALFAKGRWVARKTLTLYAWDAGTDDGTTYLAPDKESKPHVGVRLNDSKHFMRAGRRVAVGTVTFERVDGMTKPASN